LRRADITTSPQSRCIEIILGPRAGSCRLTGESSGREIT